MVRTDRGRPSGPLGRSSTHPCQRGHGVSVWLCAIFVCLVLPASGMPVANAQARLALTDSIRAVHVTSEGDSSSIVFESDGPLRASVLALRNPDRVILDLDGVQIGDVLAGLPGRFAADQGPVRAVEVRAVPGQGARLRLEFREEVDAGLSTDGIMPSGRHRLTLTIAPIGVTPAAPRPLGTESPVAAKPQVPAEEVVGEELWLELRLPSGRTLGPVLVLRRADRRLLVPRESLTELRFRLPDSPVVNFEGKAYLALDSLRGLSYQFDESAQALMLDAPPALFESTLLAGTSAALPEPMPSPPGAFLNYDLNLDRSAGRTRSAGLLELGTFGRAGSGVARFVARERQEAGEGGHSLIRLDSTWTFDMPSRLSSLRVGDAIAGSGQWGRSVRFGGIQWATNFATQPGLVFFPQPGISGEAVLPSTVDLYINDTLRLRRQVPEGPFSIQDLPVITGNGEARIVVRDVLGRERVIAQPYYASPRLLRQGLRAHAIEIGFVREQYGLESNEYGRAMAVGTVRSGLSDRVTGELRGEWLANQRTIGLAGAWLLPVGSVLDGAAAFSDGERGLGGLLALGIERQGRGFGFGAKFQAATEQFVQVGMQPRDIAPRRLAQVYLSYATSRAGSFGFGYVHQDHRDRDDVRILSLNYGLSLGRMGFVSLALLRIPGDDGQTVLGLSYTKPLGGALSMGASASMSRDAYQTDVHLQRNLPAGTGVGYRVRVAGGDAGGVEGGLALQNSVGTWRVDAARRGDANGVRLGVSGGLAIIGSTVMASRTLSDSFALVRVPGFPGVRVYADNQPVARTDSEGFALVPRIRAYERNTLRIEQADLPLDVGVDSVAIDAIPRSRSGVVVEFPVRHERGATLTLLLEDGTAMPAGALARLVGAGDGEFPVGYGGKLYLSGLAGEGRVVVEWTGGRCEVAVAMPSGDEPLPDLGDHVCRAMSRQSGAD